MCAVRNCHVYDHVENSLVPRLHSAVLSFTHSVKNHASDKRLGGGLGTRLHRMLHTITPPSAPPTCSCPSHPVRVFHPEDASTPRDSREEEVEQRCPSSAKMEKTGGAGGKPHANDHDDVRFN